VKNIKKNDEIKVISGKDNGKVGKVLQVLNDKKIIVEKINMIKRHMKRSQTFQGGIVDKPAAIDISNVALLCPSCKEITRVDKSKVINGERVRSCKKCREIIDKA